MNFGDSFIGDLDNIGRHLHIIISYPNDNRAVVITLVSTWDEYSKEDTCILRTSDGIPFIKHDSYIPYELTKLVSLDKIDSCIKQGTIKPHIHIPEEIMNRIIKGAEKSVHISNECYILMDNQHLFDNER